MPCNWWKYCNILFLQEKGAAVRWLFFCKKQYIFLSMLIKLLKLYSKKKNVIRINI